MGKVRDELEIRSSQLTKRALGHEFAAYGESLKRARGKNWREELGKSWLEQMKLNVYIYRWVSRIEQGHSNDYLNMNMWCIS